MKLDFYTKAVLTIIAFMLTVIACKTVISPETTASAQGPFTSVQFDASAKTFFDTRRGEIWIYRDILEPALKFRLTKLGQPLVGESVAK